MHQHRVCISGKWEVCNMLDYTQQIVSVEGWECRYLLLNQKTTCVSFLFCHFNLFLEWCLHFFWGCSGFKDVWYMAPLLHYFDLLSILYRGRSLLWQNVIKPPLLHRYLDVEWKLGDHKWKWIQMIYGTSQRVLTIQTVIEPHSPATNTHNLGDYYSWPIVTPHWRATTDLSSTLLVNRGFQLADLWSNISIAILVVYVPEDCTGIPGYWVNKQSMCCVFLDWRRLRECEVEEWDTPI